MDLSIDVGNLHDQIKAQKKDNKKDFPSMPESSEILDLSGLDLENEETWLYESETKTDFNYRDWLYGTCDISNNTQLTYDFIIPNVKPTKTIDTRTFTRPKKRFTRPSIEHFEQLYNSGGNCNEMISSTEDVKRNLPEKVVEEQEPVSLSTKPLHFDLSQPTSLHNFDSFMVNSAELDLFQNMSPPSLVNSLCSSTFANLMENSFIKNDPILREIRDKDFTETALLQDTEAPMFQSITESCSSLNSDSPEGFLKKMSFNATFKKNSSDNNVTVVQEKTSDTTGSSVGNNATFEIQNSGEETKIGNIDSKYLIDDSSPVHQTAEEMINLKSNQSFGNLNGTYRRTPKHSATFRKSDLKNNRLSLNLTFDVPDKGSLDKNSSKSIEKNLSNKGLLDDVNSTRTSSRTTVILHSDSIENLKKRYSTSNINVADLNRLSYCVEEKANQLNTAYKEDNVNGSNELNRTVDIKRSSLGSADSLDRMSSLSSSSKGSNKMLNMADIDAIVEMQERSLSQAMSTPKPNNTRAKTLWENNFISPIVSNTRDHLSDSELSDEYKSVKSTVSSKVSLENYPKHPNKSLGYLAGNDPKLKTTQRSSYVVANQKPLRTISNNIRASYSNLSNLKKNNTNIGGSHSNLYKPNNMIRPPSVSNLKTMGTKLKGSYTSLRPISANLPVAPPVGSTLNSTQTLTRPSTVSVIKVVDSTPTIEMQRPKEKIDGTFVKPQVIRSSGLPRPTGIPRPASRIPGPRSTNARPASSRNPNNY